MPGREIALDTTPHPVRAAETRSGGPFVREAFEMAIWTVSLIIVVSLFLLITEKIPVDLTAIGMMVALTVTGTLPPQTP